MMDIKKQDGDYTQDEEERRRHAHTKIVLGHFEAVVHSGPGLQSFLVDVRSSVGALFSTDQIDHVDRNGLRSHRASALVQKRFGSTGRLQYVQTHLVFPLF